MFVCNMCTEGSGCGSVGRVVSSKSRGPWFESSHWQKIILNIFCQLYWKDENKERGWEWAILINILCFILNVIFLFFQLLRDDGKIQVCSISPNKFYNNGVSNDRMDSQTFTFKWNKLRPLFHLFSSFRTLNKQNRSWILQDFKFGSSE